MPVSWAATAFGGRNFLAYLVGTRPNTLSASCFLTKGGLYATLPGRKVAGASGQGASESLDFPGFFMLKEKFMVRVMKTKRTVVKKLPTTAGKSRTKVTLLACQKYPLHSRI